jgi:hypothetical protein
MVRDQRVCRALEPFSPRIVRQSLIAPKLVPDLIILHDSEKDSR